MGERGWWLGGLAALLLTAGTGCGHTPTPVAVQAADSYAFRQTLGGIRVAADPFFAADRVRGAFVGGEEFAEKGLLPVQVVIENGSREAVQIHPEGAKLYRPDGRAYAGLPPADAFSLVKLGVGWWAVGAGLVGGAAPAYRNEARQKDIETRGLQEGTVPAGGSLTGFLYFTIAEGTQALAGHRLVLPVRVADGRELVFEIPIAGSHEAPKSSTPVADPRPAPLRPDQPYGGGIIIRSPK